MSANHKYFPEHLIRKAESYQKFNQRISLELGQDHFTLSSEEAVSLASFLVASYHNQYVCLCNNAEYEDADWVDAVEEFNEEN
jgi:hypothetical protein